MRAPDVDELLHAVELEVKVGQGTMTGLVNDTTASLGLGANVELARRSDLLLMAPAAADVLRLDDAETRRLKRWIIRA